MQVNNVFLPVQNLTRTTINPGGLCWVLFFLHQDVDTWPEIDPTTGVIQSDIVFKSNATFYSLQTSEKGRIFKEQLKYDKAGPFMETEVAGTVCGTTVNHILGVGAMQFGQFGILVKDRNGEKRLVGNPDCGARFDQDFSSGDIYGSRLRNVKFSFESTIPVPVYNSSTLKIGSNTYQISDHGDVTLVVANTPGDVRVDNTGDFRVDNLGNFRSFL